MVSNIVLNFCFLFPESYQKKDQILGLDRILNLSFLFPDATLLLLNYDHPLVPDFSVDPLNSKTAVGEDEW